MTNSKVLIASLALVGVALAPLALAHDDWTSHPSFATGGWGDDRVSGVYYADASLLVGHTGYDGGGSITVPPSTVGPVTTPGVVTPPIDVDPVHIGSNTIDPITVIGPIPIPPIVTPPIDVDPVHIGSNSVDPVTVGVPGTSFAFGVAEALCDLEVLSPGDGSADEFDEPEVDGIPNSASLLGLTFFNDGGVGAVCHTHTNYYANADWNTAGCNYDPAWGEDASGVSVWITTVCDYGHATSGVGLATYVQSCLNNLLTSDVNGLVTCGTSVLACFTSSQINCPLDSGLACGADDFGTGGVQTPGYSGWSDWWVPFESVPYPCSDADGAAAAFVWTAVFVDTTFLTIDLSVPTVGVIY